MKHSIFLKINIIFVTSIISLLIIFSLTSYVKIEHDNKSILQKAYMIQDLINRLDDDELVDYLSNHNLEVVDKIDDMKEHQTLIIPKKTKRNKSHTIDTDVKAMICNNHLYYEVTINDGVNFFIRDNEYGNSALDYLGYIYVAILTLVILIYVLLINSLNPLKKLQKEIIKFGNGNLNIDAKIDAKDEIANVANEFDNAVKKIKNLNSARSLFLRNVMHELKTPITKGKLCISLLDDSDNTKILNSIFDRLELLINEMADIEKISADETVLNKKDYRLIDIFDNCMDILFINKELVEHNITNEIINGDFKLLTIVLKNLIDNGIKYSTNGKIKIEVANNEIIFISEGNKLEEFEKLLQPFNKTETHKNNQKGFGLGLYIVSQILAKHNFSFNYQFIDKNNLFIINY